MRKVKSFTISEDILAELEVTKGERSASEHVNELLRRALELERRERLELEAADFFAKKDQTATRERNAYSNASKLALSRD
jgi:predicted CopG family antitoxin